MLDGGAAAVVGVDGDGVDGGLLIDDVELIDLAPMGAAPEARSRPRPRPSRRGLGIGAAGALMAVLGLWALGGGDDGAAAGPEATPTPTEPVPTTRGTTPPTTRRPTTTVDPDVAGPLLGRPRGWSILIGGWSRPDLQILDLDTGREITIPADVTPLALAGDLLAVNDDLDPAEQQVRVVTLADPAAPGLTVGEAERWRFWASPSRDGMGMWIGSVAGDQMRWHLVEPGAGGSAAVTDEVDGGPVAPGSPLLGAGPEVAGTGGGGVFTLEGDAYRQVHPGTPLAVSREYVLVTTCSSPRDCTTGWLRRDTWEPVDRPLPPNLGWALQLTPDGRFLMYRDSDQASTDDDTALLFDVERDRVVEGASPTMYLPLAVSPDDLLVAYLRSSRIEVYDVEREELVGIPLGGLASSGDRIVFIPTDGVGRGPGSGDGSGGAGG